MLTEEQKKKLDKHEKIMKRLMSGEKVECPKCGKGTFMCYGSPKEAFCFKCDNQDCGAFFTMDRRLNIDG